MASKRAQYIPDQAIQGRCSYAGLGLALHPTNSKLPGLGYARITMWNVTVAKLLSEGVVRTREVKIESTEKPV
jgi:hypothetical protein